MTNTLYYKNLSFDNKVLYILCCRSCQLNMSGYDHITTTGSLSRMLGCSQYKVRKTLKKFEEQGLVKRVCEGGCADDELRVWCIKGWCITTKVRHEEIYRRANWEESKIMWEVWQIVPSQYYVTNTVKWLERLDKGE